MWDCADARHPTDAAVSMALLNMDVGEGAHGSAIKRSVSFTILLGSAAMAADTVRERERGDVGVVRGSRSSAFNSQ